MYQVIKGIKLQVIFALSILLSTPIHAQNSLATLSLTKSCKNCDLSNQNFPFADFSSTKLFCVNFEGATLEQANFSNVNFNGSFKKSNLRGADFSRATIDSTNWAGCELDITPSDMFFGADLRGVKMAFSKFPSSVRFTNAKLDGAVLDNIRIDFGARINNTSAKNLRIQQATIMSGLTISSSNLEKSNFGMSSMQILCSSCVFDGASFNGAKMHSSEIDNSSFVGANFQNSDLTGSSLTNSDFTNADFTNATLLDVDFTNSILCNTVSPDGTILFLNCRD